MSSGPHRTMPFPGFSRGIPIVGQRAQEPPAGRYLYQIGVLVMRCGHPLSADSLEIQLSKPLEGFDYKRLPGVIVQTLRAAAPDMSDPRVVIVSVWELGFIPQEVVDRAQEQARAGANGGQAS